MSDFLNGELSQFSPYDDSFPAKLLQEAFDYRVEESKAVTEKLYCNLVKKVPVNTTFNKKTEEKMRLVVDTSDDFLTDYKSGAIKLANEKGHMVAQIKRHGRYGSKLAVREETYTEGADSLDLQTAIQLQAVKETLVAIGEQILVIDENVKQVLTGQMNDRLGLYYSGVALFIEANNIRDAA